MTKVVKAATKEKENAIIGSRAEALRTVTRFRKLEAEIAAVEREHKLDAKRREVAKLKQKVISWMKQEQKNRLDVTGGYVNLVEPSSKSWISTNADIPAHAQYEADKGKRYKSLRAILGKEMWLSVTKRVVDPQKLNELVEEGHVTEAKLAPAMLETYHAPYVRFYEESEGS